MKRQSWMAIVASIGLAGLLVKHRMCGREWPVHDGTMRQTASVQVNGLRRGAAGRVAIGAIARYTTRDADAVEQVAVPAFESITLTLIDAKQQVTPLPIDHWDAHSGISSATLTLPAVPDGDYRLHVAYVTKLGAGDVYVAVPLYTPARVHVITDRPLYEPGNLVRFRAVVLRARDLVPLDGRPGVWVVKDPNGEVMLEEKAPAGDWGVVAGTFPLDHGSPTGTWHVAWSSNGATDELPFTVEPFTLPRFHVDATPSKSFYRPGEQPIVRGAVAYSSGAPVANAKLDITWQASGAWPPPLEWEAKLLPTHALTGANGRFELTLPQIPTDLQGTATLSAQIAAVDPAGDRAVGATSVLLSEDGIVATTVTELGDGLVAGFNNRMYVRVTTPDGAVVPNAKIKLTRAWEPHDAGLDATLDEDGVASVQLDPGAPVNIVIPAVPYRPAPRPVDVSRGEVEEMIAENGASLADQVEMDKWLAALAPCAKWYEVEPQTRVALRVDTGGGIAVTAGSGALDVCVAQLLRTRRLPAGADRLYAVTFSFNDPALPKLTTSVTGALEAPEGLDQLVRTAGQDARDCLPRLAEGELAQALTWHAHAGSKVVELGGWVGDPKGSAPSAALACVTARFAATPHVALASPATTDSIGLVRFSVEPAEQDAQQRPQATTMLGYELVVSAALDQTGEGTAPPVSTKLRVTPGELPNLRLRVSSVLAKPGDTITAELIRGPNFTGELPKEIELHWLKGNSKAPLDADHKAQLVIDAATEGWCEITGGGVRALVYVRPRADLVVSVKPEHERYAPGQQALLEVRTLLAGVGGPAAVGLFGVDDSLAQLVALPGADDLGRLRPRVETSAPAFGVLDGQALTLGRIRGVNAAAATVLRVTTIPAPVELDATVDARGETRFDPVEELTDHFYNVLTELHAQTREWESTAPKGEMMRPVTMARLWQQALAACTQRGENVNDAYGRPLRLHRLPADLLALTDPHAVVASGTRLPEDVENWSAWVAKEKP